MLSPIHSCPYSIILTYTQPLLSPLHLIKISFPHSERCLSRPSPSLNVCLRVALSPSSFSCSSRSMAITIISFLVAPRVHHLCCPYFALHFYSLRSSVQLHFWSRRAAAQRHCWLMKTPPVSCFRWLFCCSFLAQSRSPLCCQLLSSSAQVSANINSGWLS